MSESESEHEKLRRASRELGEPHEFVIEPVEESEEFAAAVRDEAAVADLMEAGLLPEPAAPPLFWESMVSASDVARTLELRAVAVEPDGAVWWQETRPDDGGSRLLRRDPRRDPGEVHAVDLPADCDGDAVPVAGGAVTARQDDGQLYLIRPGHEARSLTAGPAEGQRYTDLVRSPDGREIWCVRQSRADPAAVQSIVAVSIDGSREVRTLVSATAHLSKPTPSPDASMLAWVEWDPPHMPWDGSRLRVGRLTAQGAAETRTVLGGDVESVFQPEWAAPDSLYVISDRTRWWNLYQVWLDGALRPLCLLTEEFGWPQNRPSLATYGLLADGRLAVLHGYADWRLDLLDPANGALTPLDLPYTAWQPSLRAGGNTIAGIGGGPAHPAALVAIDAASGRHQVLRKAADDPPASEVPQGRPATFGARDGHEVHAMVYPPRNARIHPTASERVPFLLLVPDGPGEQIPRMLDPSVVWFTSHGLGVAAVDCRGSSGYGRGYREQIYGQWGVADVEDCATVAHGLVERWNADPVRMAVRGTGAGGTLALEALAHTDLFAAATVYAPITDLTGLPRSARADYLREVAADSTSSRSTAWLNRVRRPVLMFHGERDTVVPTTQTTLLRDVLGANRVPHMYLTFAEEGHTFRRADTRKRTLETELSFYARAFAH